ncbi:MAG: hypothetical protein GY838_00705 [bacterium]|nr:hypothetical protein [bacterium]
MNRRGDKDRRDFVNDVLDRTSGSPCRRALELLPDLTDGALASTDRQLVQGHLEHCTGCRAVAMAMSRMGEDLVSLAVLDPGEAFTAAVLARTTARTVAAQERRRAEVASRGPAGLMDRIGRWLQRWIAAPDFAIQAAYVATVLIVALTALPISPFREAPGKMLQAVQASPGGLPVVGQAVTWSTRQVETGAAGLVGRVRSGFDAAWDDASEDWRDRSARSAADRGRLDASLDMAVDEFMDGRPAAAGAKALEAYRSGQAAWSAWWAAEQDSSEAVGP